MALDKKVTKASDNSVAVGRDLNNSSITIGYTIDQHEAALSEREESIRQQLKEYYEKKIDLENREKRLKIKELEFELEEIRSKLATVETSYRETVMQMRDSAQRIRVLTAGVISADPQKALNAWREIADSDGPDAARASFEAGKLAEINFDLPETLRLYKRAVSLDMNNSVYLNALGTIYYKLGRFALSKQAHENALAVWSGEASELKATMQHNLAELYLSLIHI